ncbi:MAG: glycoside hydrolase family 64 protein [Eubacterium sp.]
MKRQIIRKLLASTLVIALLITGLSIPTTKNIMAGTAIGNASDYTVSAEDTSSSVSKITFKAANYAQYVIVHYNINDGAQQNVNMSSNDGYNYSYDIAGLKKGDKIKCSFTYNKGGLQYDSPEMAYTTGSYAATDASIAAPFGLVVNSPKNNTISVVWGRGEINTYNVYIDGKIVDNGVGCAYYEYSGYAAGTHEVSVTTVNGNKESVKTTLTVNVKGSSVQPTEAPTTAAPTTPAPTQSTVDSGIAKPFGMVVGNPSNGTVSVVWGRGNIDSYNVYIDGKQVASKVGCGYYEYSGYAQGTHQVSVTTVSGNKESEKTTMSVTVAAGALVQPTTQPSTEKPTTSSVSKPAGDYEVPYMRTDIAERDDKMYLQLNNKTNGRFSDNQIYWCVLGYNEAKQLCYLDTNGNLIPANTGMNTITKNDRKCANICHSLAEKDYVYLPSIESGRMYLSYGEPVYVTFNEAADGRIGYAGPDLNNTSDPNRDVLFEFAEFTVTGKEYWGNTTRVDFFSFPMVTRLVGTGGFNNRPGDADTYDKVVGDLGTRDEVFAKYQAQAPDAWKTLADSKRIMAPCKSTFNEGQQYGNYFDAYINEFWNKYSSQDLVFKCEAGTFRGRVEGDRMRFTKDGDNGTYYVYKPTTQDVLEGKGNFDKGNSTELVIEAQLCAAFNRGVATEPENYGNPNAYYKNNTYNYYSKFWHENSVNDLAYGFCYDDVFDQSTLLHYTNARALIIDLKW